MNQIQYNERDVFEALGKYKCDTGMSVENVLADCGKEEECCWTVYSQVEVRNVLGTSFCCKRVNIVEKK